MSLVVHKSWAGFGEAAPSTDSEETIDAFQELERTSDRCALPHRARSSWIQPSTRSTAKSTRCRMMMPDRSTPGKPRRWASTSATPAIDLAQPINHTPGRYALVAMNPQGATALMVQSTL